MTYTSGAQQSFPKAGEVRLEGDDYTAVVIACYRRDKWRCRRCNTRWHLSPHHLIKRSAQRLDTLENLVTLCIDCHRLVEASKVEIHGGNANEILRFRWSRGNG